MIVRILGEGQWVVSDELRADLNDLDAKVNDAVDKDDQDELTAALERLLAKVREHAQEVPDDVVVESDFILPDESATLEEIRQLLDETPEFDGLIPD